MSDKRLLVLKIRNHELKRKEIHIVEWPNYCTVTFGQFMDSAPRVHSIQEITDCGNCLYYSKSCEHKHPWLWSTRVSP